MIQTDITLCGGGYTAQISSLHGGTCFRLLHEESGADLLRTPEDEAHLATNVFLFGNPPLFPPNRIQTGKFTFAGRDYTLPLNEPETGCHIHGALYQKRFSVEERTGDSVRLSYHAEAGEYIGFPHSFSLIRAYRLDENGLHEATTVKNRSGETMPFLLAYHTTFNIPFLAGGDAQAHRVRLQVGREEVRTPNFIPTGEFRAPRERERALQSGTYVPFGTHLSAFYEAAGEMTLTDTRRGVSIVYEGDAQFGYRMLFQPADGAFFVCEPQTTAIDCFHLEGDPTDWGLITLLPGEERTFRTRMGIRIEKGLFH